MASASSTSPDHTTRLAGVSGRTALAIVALLVLAMTALLVVALAPQNVPAGAAAAGQAGDIETYSLITDRMRQGADYYSAAHAELLAGGYGTRSVFNWRTPLYPALLALSPSAMWSQRLLTVLAIVAGALATVLVRRQAGPVAGGIMAAALVLSLMAVLAPGTVYFSEIAAGVLILVSVSAYGLGWWVAGLAAALAALFVRELAAPYVLVALGLAIADRRWRETGLWVVGLAAYAAYFFWHAEMVWAQLGPTDAAYPESWVQFGGLGFILATAHIDGVLFALPLWVTAIVLPPALAGLFAWRGARAGRAGLTVAAYLLTFAIVGKPFDGYWGAIYTPLLAFGLAALPAAARDLLLALRRPAGVS